MSRWYTVPNFISIYDLDSSDHYHLFEGYGVEVLGEKKSGYYRKIKIEGSYPDFLLWIGYSDWWKEYKPNKSFFGRIFKTWTKKV